MILRWWTHLGSTWTIIISTIFMFVVNVRSVCADFGEIRSKNVRSARSDHPQKFKVPYTKRRYNKYSKEILYTYYVRI